MEIRWKRREQRSNQWTGEGGECKDEEEEGGGGGRKIKIKVTAIVAK